MFFKKKVTTSAQFDMGMLFIEMATELYRGLGRDDGSSLLSATLEFDEQQRVSNIKNLLVDGVLKVPSFEAMNAMNVLTQPMANLPANQKLKSLAIRIEGGHISTDAEYLAS